MPEPAADPPSPQAQGPAHSEASPAPDTEFRRDLSASLVAEFRRLAIMNGWKRKTKTYKKERQVYFVRWATEDFEEAFGVTANRLDAWQRLCRHLGVGEGLLLGSIGECHKAVAGTFVNIVDLVDSLKTGTRPRIFGSAQELAKYILRTGKRFPLDKARTSPMLSKFLIRVGIYRGKGKSKKKKQGNPSSEKS